ncbi:Hypothetical predicted protein, partial [Marmota monax]
METGSGCGGLSGILLWDRCSFSASAFRPQPASRWECLPGFTSRNADSRLPSRRPFPRVIRETSGYRKG